jgi:hypothetical protein
MVGWKRNGEAAERKEGYFLEITLTLTLTLTNNLNLNRSMTIQGKFVLHSSSDIYIYIYIPVIGLQPTSFFFSSSLSTRKN